VQKQDVEPSKSGKYCRCHVLQSNPEIAKIMAALEQLNQQNQAKSASFLSNWGETGSGQQIKRRSADRFGGAARQFQEFGP
jgi:hypothetical protein